MASSESMKGYVDHINLWKETGVIVEVDVNTVLYCVSALR